MRKRFYLDSEIIKRSISPYDFYMKEQNLSSFNTRSRLWVVAGLCPFHDDDSPGSFFVNRENGAFKCFSCDAKGGDIISFVMQKYDLSFRDALELLANEGGGR